MRSYQILDEDGQPLGYGCGPRPPTAGDIEVVREFAEELRRRKTPGRSVVSLMVGERREGPAGPVPRCTCTHGADWHAGDGCEARGCPCEARP